jgi:glycosyltransferase involved in cell wall biosynthesis
MKYPKVSCYCATYGRPLILEEAIYSFLQQDYKGEKELIILNDYADHILEYNHPEIKIYNIPTQITPLGKKFNETVKLTTGEIIFPWEDDDIYLPHRISYTVNQMLLSGLPIFHTNYAFFEESQYNIILSVNTYHTTMAMKRHVFDATNGYTIIKDHIIDLHSMHQWFTLFNYTSKHIQPTEYFYIYRWGTTNSYHGSWWADIDMPNNALEYLNQHNNIHGQYTLQPHWKYNYLDHLPI